MTQEMARALCDAGYMPVTDYIRICKENGWQADLPNEGERKK